MKTEKKLKYFIKNTVYTQPQLGIANSTVHHKSLKYH